jgi:SpoU rRNA methylase family enzyme
MQCKVAEWRQKARDGALTLEEMKEAIAFLRQERIMMPPSKASTKKTVDADALLGELGI